MESSFDSAFEMVIGLEGKPSNDPADSGGYTIWGLAKKYNPEARPDMPIEEAKAIYRARYWDKIGADDLPYPLDMIAFDTAVNMGLSLAGRLLIETKSWPEYLDHRLIAYDMICKKYPKNQKFIRGWQNRVTYLRKRFDKEA